MSPGDVVFWPGFTFQDGGQSNKLLLVLAVRETDGARFMLKTTSQAKHYTGQDKDGCHSGASVHRFKQNLGGFKIPTWVQFDPAIFRNVTQANDAGAHVVFKMKDNDFKAVVNCYRKSEDCSPKLATLLPK